MPSSRFKHVCCNSFNKKIRVEKSKKKICVAFRPRYLKIFKPDDVSCTQCRIEANEMEMKDFCCKYIQSSA